LPIMQKRGKTESKHVTGSEGCSLGGRRGGCGEGRHRGRPLRAVSVKASQPGERHVVPNDYGVEVEQRVGRPPT